MTNAKTTTPLNIQAASQRDRLRQITGLGVVPAIDSYNIIKFPLSTEKSIRQIEFDNKLVFVIDARAHKLDVKKAVEDLFKVKVEQVNIHNSFGGQKRAYVKLKQGSLASDVSADLRLI